MNARVQSPVMEHTVAPRSPAAPDAAELQARELGERAQHGPVGAWSPVAPRPAAVRPAVASSGEALAPALRGAAEARLGYDLSAVRIHRDPAAERFADAEEANAVTVGRDVYFGRGAFAPGTGEGDRRLGHELVHAVQQLRWGVVALQREDKKKKKPAGPPPEISKMTDAEKEEQRRMFETEAEQRAGSVLGAIDALPDLAALDAGDKAKVAALRAQLQEARKGAEKVSDAGDKSARLAVLSAAESLLNDKYFVHYFLRIPAVIDQATVAAISDSSRTLKAEEIAMLDGDAALMRTGGKAVIRHIAITEVYREAGVDPEWLKTETLTETEAESGGKPADALTVEDKQRLQELYGSVPKDTEGGDVIDPKILAEKIRGLDDEGFEQLKEFVKQRPPAAGEEAPPIEEMLDRFKELSPAERDTLLVNRELAMDLPGKPNLDGKVLLDLAKGDAPLSDAAQQFDSNLQMINALVTDPDKMKGKVPYISVDVGLFEKELAFFRGLLGGGASQSDLVRGAVTDLTAAMAAAQKELQEQLLVEAGITAAVAWIPVAGEAKLAATMVRLEQIRRKIDKVRKAYAIVDEVQSFLRFVADLPTLIEDFRAFMDQAAMAYTTYLPMLEQLDDMPELDEKIAEIEDGMAEKFDELLDTKFGDVLERLYIPPETPPEELLRIIYTLPRGIDALEAAWVFYDSTTDATPQAAERILVRAAKAGALLYPLVGFLAAFAAERIGAAFPDLGIAERVVGTLAGYHKDKTKRRDANRAGFQRLNRRRYDYNEADLNPYLDKGAARLDELIADDEPGQHWIPAWLRVTLREEVKNLNREYAKETVPARVKSKPAKGGKGMGAASTGGATERVPLPPFRLKFLHADRDANNETVELSLNPTRKKKYDTLSNDDFKKTEGVPYVVTGRAKRAAALKKWLEERKFRVIQNNAGNPHIRLSGGTSDAGGRTYLHLDATASPSVLRAGIRKDDYKDFLGRTIEDSDDLPEGFYLKTDSSGAIVSRKPGVRKDQEAPALGLDADGKLTEGGRSKLGPEVKSPVGVTKPGDADLESYDWEQALKTTLSGGDYDPQDGRVGTWERRAANTKWGDMKKRPKRVSGELGYVLRARAFGDNLGSIFPPELKKTDDKGHLVAKRFGGDDHLNNIIPMKRSVNQFPGKWYDLEGDMAKVYTGKTATPGHRLWVSIEIDYASGMTRRPNRFRVEWKELSSTGGAAVSGKGSGRKISIPNV